MLPLPCCSAASFTATRVVRRRQPTESKLTEHLLTHSGRRAAQDFGSSMALRKGNHVTYRRCTLWSNCQRDQPGGRKCSRHQQCERVRLRSPERWKCKTVESNDFTQRTDPRRVQILHAEGSLTQDFPASDRTWCQRWRCEPQGCFRARGAV